MGLTKLKVAKLQKPKLNQTQVKKMMMMKMTMMIMTKTPVKKIAKIVKYKSVEKPLKRPKKSKKKKKVAKLRVKLRVVKRNLQRHHLKNPVLPKVLQSLRRLPRHQAVKSPRAAQAKTPNPDRAHPVLLVAAPQRLLVAVATVKLAKLLLVKLGIWLVNYWTCYCPPMMIQMLVTLKWIAVTKLGSRNDLLQHNLYLP